MQDNSQRFGLSVALCHAQVTGGVIGVSPGNGLTVTMVFGGEVFGEHDLNHDHFVLIGWALGVSLQIRQSK